MEGYIGEIRLFAGNFAPEGWAFCDGTTYNISDYEAAYSILGAVYGGNGQTQFNVPDLRGRIAVGTGKGPGLTEVTLGEAGGTETVTMTTAQMPLHNHVAAGSVSFPTFSESGNTGSPAGMILGGLQGAYSAGPADTHLAPVSATGNLSVTGNGLPFSIVQPVLATNYIICLIGIYPNRDN